ncbi:hypothetical protein L9F63_003770, partial [Diploptera punctata]
RIEGKLRTVNTMNYNEQATMTVPNFILVPETNKKIDVVSCSTLAPLVARTRNLSTFFCQESRNCNHVHHFKRAQGSGQGIVGVVASRCFPHRMQNIVLRYAKLSRCKVE